MPKAESAWGRQHWKDMMSSGREIERPGVEHASTGHRGRYDAAIVFVHGVGSQGPGESLAQGVDALLQTGAVRVGTGVPGDACAVVLDIPDRHGRRRTVVCVEGWWDRIVHDHADSPRPWRVWAWSLLLLPFLVSFGSAVAIIAAAHRQSVSNLGSATAAHVPMHVGPLVRLALGAFQSSFWRAAVIAPLLEIALLTLGGVWMVVESAWSFATGKTGPLSRGLRYVLGDAWAYADSSVRDEVLSYLASRVQFAHSQSRRVVVVGHSQGAALCRLLTAECTFDALVTIGSGTNYLGAARRRRWGRVVYGWSLMALYGLGLSLLLHLVADSIISQVATVKQAFANVLNAAVAGFAGQTNPAVDSAHGDLAHAMFWSAFDPVTIASMATGLLALVAVWVVRVDEPSPDWGSPSVGYWVDIASIYDPVSVGGAGSAEADVSIAVVNSRRPRDLLAEHVRYFSNAEVGMAIRSTVLDEPLQTRYVAPTDPHTILRASWAWGLFLTLPLAYLGPFGIVVLLLPT